MLRSSNSRHRQLSLTASVEYALLVLQVYICFGILLSKVAANKGKMKVGARNSIPEPTTRKSSRRGTSWFTGELHKTVKSTVGTNLHVGEVQSVYVKLDFCRSRRGCCSRRSSSGGGGGSRATATNATTRNSTRRGRKRMKCSTSFITGRRSSTVGTTIPGSSSIWPLTYGGGARGGGQGRGVAICAPYWPLPTVASSG